MFRNITIKLGYANAKLYKCGKCPAPQCYISYGSSKEDNVKCTQEGCEATMVLSRHVSFVDCPGHDTLMATMLAGAAVMDAALLLVDGNQAYPQPQTREHLIAVDIMKLEHIIVLQNKIDIAIKDRHSVQHQQEQIKASLSSSGNVASAPIIPISAQLKFNIDVVVDYLCRIPIPERQFTVAPYMIVIRSFDVNKPGEDAETLKGGVAGGTILKGCLRVGDEVCIRPGYVSKSKKTGLTSWVEIKSRIISLQADDNQLMYAVPGGLIAVGMKVDPQFTRSDAMVGHIIGLPDQMPQVFIEIDVQTTFLKRIVGSKDEQSKGNKIENIRENETLLINIGSTSCGGIVMSVRDVSKNSGNSFLTHFTFRFSEHGSHPNDKAHLRQHGRQNRSQSQVPAQLQTHWLGCHQEGLREKKRVSSPDHHLSG